MRSRMRMRIFVPVLILIILFPVLSWGIFSSASDWYMKRLARQSLTGLLDSIQTIADETYSGREPMNMDEEKERSKELMSQLKTLIRKGQPQAQLLAMNTRLKLTYPKEQNYQPDTLALYQVCKELILDTGQQPQTDSIREVTVGDTHYLVGLHETDGAANIRGKYLFGYISVPDTRALLSYTGGLLLLIAVILSLLSLTAAWFVAGSIARPLRALCRQTRLIGQGRFSRITQPCSIQEMEELRCSFNRMAEELEQMHQQQTTFFQNASHELRTPLMSICGYAQGIQHNVFTDHEKAAGIILSESMRMKELVDGILTISKMDSRLITLKPETLDLNEFAGEELSVLKGMEITEHISMELIPSPQPVTVTADPSLLSIALRNVISNCARYAAERVVAYVSVGEIGESDVKGYESGQEKWAVITIMDDGPGFSEQDLFHVFDRFYKGPDGNFGIGLSVVRAAMEYLEGQAEAGNRKPPEHGAVFTLKLHL